MSLFIAFDGSGTQIDLTDDPSYVAIRTDRTWDTTSFEFSDYDPNTEIFEKNTTTGVISIVPIVPFDDPIITANEETIVRDGRTISSQLYFEGFGINSTSVTGFMRRFNGMSITKTAGMMFNSGAIIEMVEFTTDNNVSNRRFQLRHYNRDGGDQQTILDVPVTEEQNQFLYLDNLDLFIPGRRRFTPFLTGASFRYPQCRIGYRRVF